MSDTQAGGLYKLRCAYVKQGRLAYLGHLEVLHTIERIVRRAQLPFAVTQGFSPHMRVAFTSALPVGTSSDEELFDLVLTSYVPPAEALARLKAAAPCDLAPTNVCYVDMRTPALTAAITRAAYRVVMTMRDGLACDGEVVADALDRVVAMGSIPYLRGKKSKVLDLSATLVEASIVECTAGRIVLDLDTRIGNDGSLRPEIFVVAFDRILAGALGCDEVREGPIVSTGIQDLSSIKRYAVCRTAQYVEDADGSLLSPLRAGETPSAPISVSSVPSL